MPGRYSIEGHAIVSADDCIADAEGRKPAGLDNEADWRNFQREMDRSVLVVLGRASYDADTDRKPRNRLILSRSVTGLAHRDGAWWWNPADVGLDTALETAAPDGGLVGVPGGKHVFDYFLEHGMDAFHLARAHRVRLPGGQKVFSAAARRSAENCLADAGFRPGPTETLDAEAEVTLTVWRR